MYISMCVKRVLRRTMTYNVSGPNDDARTSMEDTSDWTFHTFTGFYRIFLAQRCTGILQVYGISNRFYRHSKYMASDWTIQTEAIEDTILRWLWRIAAPILLGVGSIGNAFPSPSTRAVIFSSLLTETCCRDG